MGFQARLRGALLVILGAALTIVFQYMTRPLMGDLRNSERVFPIGNTSLSVTVTSQNVSPSTKITQTTVTSLVRTTAEILRWNSTQWYEWQNFCSGPRQFDLATLRLPAGNLNMYIHDVSVDQWVSGAIKKHGGWEKDIMSLIQYYLSTDKDLNLLDIGSHIGQFSLMAAKMGRKAVAVDPLLENVLRLCKSIELNKFTSAIKVFYVALSDSRQKVTFARQAGNIGGTKVKSVSTSTDTSFNPNIIDTVFIDDLLPLIPFRKAFMKMDVESHENSVLKGGNNFFATIDIPYVLMEWFQHAKNPRSAMEIIHFMTIHNYKPYQVNLRSVLLNTSAYGSWPQNVLWKK